MMQTGYGRAGLVLMLLAGAVAAQGGVTLEGRVVGTPGHVLTLGETGLPGQLVIRAHAQDLPLSRRGGDASDVVLQGLGRGPQFAVAARLEAVLDGAVVVAVADAPAALRQTEDGVEAVAAWTAGGLRGGLRLLYTADGAMTGEVRYQAGTPAFERLELVLELAGPVDTAITGDPAAARESELPSDYGTLANETGVLWRDGPTPAGNGGMHAGPVRHFFLGSGDRGFTWLAHEGTALSSEAPSMQVERRADGVTVWRIALVNKVASGGGEQTVGFVLLTHPSRARAADRRMRQWQVWDGEALQPGLAASARGALDGDLVRADAGSVHEAAAQRVLLRDAAGGAAGDARVTLADRFPIGLFRYLSASHTALAAQLRTDAAALVPAGGSPAADRMALGRALLHDIGVDLASLSGVVEAAAVVRALAQFGVFEDDGQTEFLPYWRTGGIVRYGEAFDAGAGFEVTEENPAVRARVSVFIRPIAGQARLRKALFVVVNEAAHALREQLYIGQPAYLFGGPNQVTAASVYSQLDFARIPEDSDWRRGLMIGSAIGYARGDRPTSTPQLMDLETGGFVRSVATGDDSEVYGLIHVPARGMRLLYGAGAR